MPIILKQLTAIHFKELIHYSGHFSTKTYAWRTVKCLALVDRIGIQRQLNFLVYFYLLGGTLKSKATLYCLILSLTSTTCSNYLAVKTSHSTINLPELKTVNHTISSSQEKGHYKCNPSNTTTEPITAPRNNSFKELTPSSELLNMNSCIT